MALGYCSQCGKLVTIVPRGQSPSDPEGRRQAWYPVEHDNNDGRPCAGKSRPL